MIKKSRSWALCGDARIAALAVTAMALSHCDREPDHKMSIEIALPIAVGATVPAYLVDACSKSRTPSGSTNPSCSSAAPPLDLRSAHVDDTSVFEVLPRRREELSSVQVRAKTAGATTLHVEGHNSHLPESLETAIRSASPDRLTLAPPSGCPSIVVGTGYPFRIVAQRFSGAELLHGVGGAYPMSSDMAVADLVDGSKLTAASKAGKGSIRSTVNGAVLPVRVFDVSEVTALDVEVEPSVPSGVELQPSSPRTDRCGSAKGVW